MKTVFKRLLSLALVAMMLVSVVPFQASAAGDTPVSFTTLLQEYNYSTGHYEDVKNGLADAVYDGYVVGADKIAEWLGVSLNDYVEYHAYYDIKDGNGWQPLGAGLTMDANYAAEGVKFALEGKKAQTKYTVTYKVNGETFKTEEVVAGTTITPAAGDLPAKYTAADYDITVPAAVTVNKNEEINFTATIKKFDVNYIVNGEVAKTVKVEKGTKLNPSADDVEEDYPAEDYKVQLTSAGEVVVTAATDITFTATSRWGRIELWDLDPVDKEDAEFYQYLKTYDGEVAETVPNGPKHNGYVFTRWTTQKNNYGEVLEKGMDVDDDTIFYAQYTKNQDDDGLSKLTVKAKVYVGDRYKDKTYVVLEDELEDGTDILKYLINHEDDITERLFGDGADDWNLKSYNYEWEERYYYDDTFEDELTQADAELSGDTTVYIKLRDLREVKVDLVVHKTVSNSYSTVIKMEGYRSTDILEKADIKEALKKKYPNATYTFTGMYSEEQWEDKVDGKDPNAQANFRINDYVKDGYVEVHILAKKTGTVNGDNPKTGDGVMMAVTVLALSATALAGFYFANKKKHSV